MILKLTPLELKKGDHITWNGFPYEVVVVNEGRYGAYVLGMRLQPEGLRIPEEEVLDVERQG